MSGAGAFAMLAADRFGLTGVAARWLAAACLVLLAEGCRERPTTVSGTITLDGQPLAVAPNARGTVVFQPIGGQGTLATGVIDATGNFSMATGGSIEVAPGKYQVAVSVVQLLPKLEDAEQGTELVTPAKYSSAHQSGFEADVVPGENRLSFDLVSTSEDEATSDGESPADEQESDDDSEQTASPARDD